jgi:hypothetical protein
MSCRFAHFDGRPRLLAGSSGSSAAHCASVRSARAVTAKVATRSPCRWSSSSLTHLPETSSVTGQRHAGIFRSHRDAQLTLETGPSPSQAATGLPSILNTSERGSAPAQPSQSLPSTASSWRSGRSQYRARGAVVAAPASGLPAAGRDSMKETCPPDAGLSPAAMPPTGRNYGRSHFQPGRNGQLKRSTPMPQRPSPAPDNRTCRIAGVAELVYLCARSYVVNGRSDHNLNTVIRIGRAPNAESARLSTTPPSWTVACRLSILSLSARYSRSFPERISQLLGQQQLLRYN